MELRGLGDIGLALAVNPAAAWAAILVAALTLVRLVVAATLPLAPDETYYWIWSHALAGGYLDHPPMVALWIRAGTFLSLDRPRWGFGCLVRWRPLSRRGCCSIPRKPCFPARKAGVPAVLLLNASLLLGVGTVIMTPDSPLLLFLDGRRYGRWRVLPLVADGGWWLVAGVAGGLALDSKYTALLLWIGVGLWVLLVPAARRWLRRWQPWTACVIGLALFSPVVFWNVAHDWAGFTRQGGRVQDWHPARAIGFLAELLGGQIALVTPLVWALCIAGLIVAIHRTWQHHDPCWSLLAALSLPPILVFVQHAIGDRVQGNWPAIIYPALAVAAGGMALRPRLWVGACALGFAITAVVYMQATTGLMPLPPRLNPIALRLTGWDGLADQVEAVRKAAGADFVVASGYAVSSELAWWLPEGVRVIATDSRWRLFDLPSTVGPRT